MSAKWQGACVPPDIRRPWDVFQEDVSDRAIGPDRSSDPHHAIHEELRAVQELNNYMIGVYGQMGDALGDLEWKQQQKLLLNLEFHRQINKLEHPYSQ